MRPSDSFGTSTVADLEISLFGGLRVRCGTDEHIEIPGRKDCALLGYLAVSRGVPCSREKLATLLWGNSGDRQARDSLKQALLRLRRSFSLVFSMPLVTNRQSVTLDRDSVTVDVGAFEQLLGDATPEALERAIALYRGDLLEGIQVREPTYEDWLLVERQRLRALAVEAATRLMTQSLLSGWRDRATTSARRLLNLEPLHEEACRTLMQVHADRGERTQALKLFESLRDRLQQELGVAPEPDTIRLYRSIRAQRHGQAFPLARSSAGNRNSGQQPWAIDGFAEKAARDEDHPRKARSKPSIAVLPFVKIGGDLEEDDFADGLTEDIITDLSRVSALFVAARHTVFTFKGRAVGVQQAARELGVSHVLEGSVRKAGGRVRITAQLVDGATGDHLWANRYDHGLSDMFAVQDEITKIIVDILKVKLLPQELERPASHSTASVDAHQYYLAGRSFYLRGIDKHGLRIAREMFAKAVEIDSRYARAYAALAICESYLAMGDPHATYQSFLANSRRALELDPHLAEAHALKGLALYAEGLYTEAAPEFERALRLEPDLYETHFFYARNCRLQGLHEQAAALFKRAATLRPNEYRSLGLLAKSYKVLGWRQEFVVAARECLERVEAEIEAHPDNAGALAFGSTVLAETGQRARAEDWAARAIMIGPDDYVVRYNAARAYALLGELGTAFDWLERSFDSSAVWQRRLALWMKSDHDVDPLRGHPRFHALVQRLRAVLEPATGCGAAFGSRRTICSGSVPTRVVS